MYFDTKPCEECGSEVRLRASSADAAASEPDHPVGPADGVVGGADATVDERVCTNPDCPSNRS